MRTWLEVDFGRIEKNIGVVKGVLPEGCRIIAVVKANAYGHGDVQVAKMLEGIGIGCFAVACTDEAVTLRRAGVVKDILVLGYTDPKDAALAAENGITLACVGPEHLEALAKAIKSAPVKPLNVHLALNTGMNRIGFSCEGKEAQKAVSECYRRFGKGAPESGELCITGIFSHFSSSDDLSEGADEYTKLQLSRYQAMLDYLAGEGIDPGLRHISNSGAIGKYPQARFDAVRCGALLYGYNTAMDAKLPVEPAMQWKTRVTCIRTLEKGDAVSYSRKFVADGPRTIATLGIGYADGLSRQLSNKGFVLINGRKAKIAGNICMDQMMADVTDIPGVSAGDEAVIIGRSGDLAQTADDIAEYGNTCMHEVLSTIGLRVERYYK